MTPLEKVEALYDELVAHYGAGEDKEIRAAAKLLLVALAKVVVTLVAVLPAFETSRMALLL